MATEAIAKTESGLPYGGITGTLEIGRDRLLNLLADVIQTQHTKITSGRIKDAKNERIRLESVRVLAYTCSVYNAVLKDKSLCEIEARLDALENANIK